MLISVECRRTAAWYHKHTFSHGTAWNSLFLLIFRDHFTSPSYTTRGKKLSLQLNMWGNRKCRLRSELSLSFRRAQGGDGTKPLQMLKMEKGAKMHMKEWLIAQVENGVFRGLCWEDEDKTMFRIPWKHAAKKDYRQTADAALFKAWAVYKGKYREGWDKADPTMWKTRLRCALNKSTDFQEVPERNQLDITEPYKVYLITPHQEPPRPAELPQTKDQMMVQAKRPPETPSLMHKQKASFQATKEEVKSRTENLMMDHMYCEFSERNPENQNPGPGPGPDPGPGPGPGPGPVISPALSISDFRMQVVLLYHGHRVMNVTTRGPDGCFITQGCVPLGNEWIYGPCAAQQLSFPPPGSIPLLSGMAEAMSRLLCHLERGVLLWVAPDGLFIKRFCQGRVYWSGPLAQHSDQPNKLEREKTCKLLDVPRFLRELQSCLKGRRPMPRYEIELCFGEEYPDPAVPNNRKLIMAKVVPLFAVELLQRYKLEGTEEKRPSVTFQRRPRADAEDRGCSAAPEG